MFYRIILAVFWLGGWVVINERTDLGVVVMSLGVLFAHPEADDAYSEHSATSSSSVRAP